MALNITQIKMGDAQKTGNWDPAIEWASKGVDYSKKGNFKIGIRRCNWQLGICWMQKGDYPQALHYFYEVQKASYKDNAASPLVNTYSWIARCHMLLGDYQQALKVFHTGLKIYNDRYAEMNNNIKGPVMERYIKWTGDCYLKLNNYPEAITWYEKMISNNQTDSLGIAYARIAYAQLETKNYDAALKHLQAAIRFHPNLLKMQPDNEYEGIMGEFYKQIGETYYRLGSIQKDPERKSFYNEAINYLNKSVPLLKNGAGGKENLMDAFALLKQACEAINDYQNALFYSNSYNHLKDSIYNKTTYLKLADQQIRIETEKTTSEFKANQEREKIEQKALSDKMLADQRLEDEQKIADEKLNKVRSIAEERVRSANLVAAEKSKQEKLRAQKQQTNNLLLMGLILVAVTSVFLILYLRQRHQKKIAIQKAETVHKMAELELQSLRAQLNPHFMFNSLNSLQRLILMEESDKSQSYLARFSKMLRMLLENADKPFIPLQREIDFLQLYLGLEKLRLPDLQYSISTDPSLNTERTLIPNMILQPYVENAIWHGLSHKENDKQVQVRIYRENGSLNCEVEDNGVGRKKAEELKSLFRKQHQSKGMELLTKRFKLLNEEFGSSIQAMVTDKTGNNEDTGTLVTIKIPVMQTA
jgi:hypothetical protein